MNATLHHHQGPSKAASTASRLLPQGCFFRASAPTQEAIPPAVASEIVFWGRSNVGKSSLLNALMGRKNLARCSKTPGCTRAIIFYEVHPTKLYIADLPGYGYARVSAQEQGRWDELMTHYFTCREALRRVYLLVDARHGPKASDENARIFLEDHDVPYTVIFTKVDKASREQQDICMATVGSWRLDGLLPFFFVSTRNSQGIVPLRDSIEGEFLV